MNYFKNILTFKIGKGGKKQEKIYTWLEACAFFLLILQVLALCYMNLFQMQKHIGFDASTHYLRAIEIWKHKTLFSDSGIFSSSLYLDSTVIIAAFLYGLTGNIFTAYGIGNIILDGFLILVFYYILRQAKMSRLAILAVLNLLICPYLSTDFINTNDLGYYSTLLTSANYYGLKMIIVLLVIKTVMMLEAEKKAVLLVAVTSFFCFFTGLSSGYYVLVTAILPCILYLFIKSLMRNDWKYLWHKTMAFLVLQSGLVISGKIVAAKVIGFVSRENEMVWVGAKDFWRNLASIFQGYLLLLGALPMNTDKPVMGKEIVYIFNIILVFILFTACFVTMRRAFKPKDLETNKNFLLFIIVLIFNILMFTLVYMTYSNEIFEWRYLIPCHLMIIIFVGYFIDSLRNDLWLKKLGMVLLLGVILGIALVSNVLYCIRTIDTDQYDQIAYYLNDKNITVAYVWGDGCYIDGRNLRAYDDERYYKTFGQSISESENGSRYTYFDENMEYDGPTAMITMEKDFKKLPLFIQNKYSKQINIDKIVIYTSRFNWIDWVSGVTEHPVNRDFMYSPGIVLQNGEFDENGDYIAGKEGNILSGPNTIAANGTYSFTLQYEVLEGQEDIGTFSILADDKSIGETNIVAGNNQTTVSPLKFDNNMRMSYDIDINEGVKIKLQSITIRKIE